MSNLPEKFTRERLLQQLDFLQDDVIYTAHHLRNDSPTQIDTQPLLSFWNRLKRIEAQIRKETKP